MVEPPPSRANQPKLKLLLPEHCDAYWVTVPDWMMLNTKTSEVFIRLSRYSAARRRHQYNLPILLPVSACENFSSRGSRYCPLQITVLPGLIVLPLETNHYVQQNVKNLILRYSTITKLFYDKFKIDQLIENKTPLAQVLVSTASIQQKWTKLRKAGLFSLSWHSRPSQRKHSFGALLAFLTIFFSFLSLQIATWFRVYTYHYLEHCQPFWKI